MCRSEIRRDVELFKVSKDTTGLKETEQQMPKETADDLYFSPVHLNQCKRKNTFFTKIVWSLSVTKGAYELYVHEFNKEC